MTITGGTGPLPTVYDTVRAEDGVSWITTPLSVADTEAFRKTTDSICRHCKQEVVLVPEARDIHLLYGELHHYPDCLEAAKAAR